MRSRTESVDRFDIHQVQTGSTAVLSSLSSSFYCLFFFFSPLPSPPLCSPLVSGPLFSTTAIHKAALLQTQMSNTSPLLCRQGDKLHNWLPEDVSNRDYTKAKHKPKKIKFTPDHAF